MPPALPLLPCAHLQTCSSAANAITAACHPSLCRAFFSSELHNYVIENLDLDCWNCLLSFTAVKHWNPDFLSVRAPFPCSTGHTPSIIMWTIRHQTPENIEVVLAMHTAQFNKRNVLCEMTATCVTVGMVSTLSSLLLFLAHSPRQCRKMRQAQTAARTRLFCRVSGKAR